MTKFLTDQMDTIHAGEVSITDLKSGDKPITVTLPDKDDSRKINLDDYDIEVDNDNPFVERVSVSTEGDEIRLSPKLRGDWCDCFMPDSLTFHVKLVPKSQDSKADYIDLPVTIKVVQQSTWLRRCLWVLLTIAGLLLLLFYLWATAAPVRKAPSPATA